MRWLHGAAVSSVAATALAATLAAQSGPDLVTRYREANGPRILRDFATLLTYPNRARDTADIERAAGYIRDQLLAAGVKAGLTLQTMLDVMQKTMAWNAQLAVAMQSRPLIGDFSPGFMLKLAHKDCRLALTMIRDLELAAPVGTATLGACAEVIAAGYGANDVGVLLKVREEAAGVAVRLPAKT